MAQSELKVKLTEHIKSLLGQRATGELLKEVDPALLAEMQADAEMPTLAALVAKKVIRLALDPQKSHQWAVELIMDRTEGRAVQGAPPKEDGRIIQEKLDNLTREHINSLTTKFAEVTAASVKEFEESQPSDDDAGPAARLLDLPRNGISSPKEAEGESSVEAEPADEGGE